MTPGFAQVYLWARRLQQAEPANREARWLVILLRQWDDLERRRRHWPDATSTNLQATVEQTILALVRRLRGAKRGGGVITVIVECPACAGSGQWPNHDGSVIRECHVCDGQASWNLNLTGKLERDIRWLVVQQQDERRRPA